MLMPYISICKVLYSGLNFVSNFAGVCYRVLCLLHCFAFILQVFVKMTDLETDHEWIWERQHFLNCKFVMQEMFSKHQDGEDWQMSPVSTRLCTCVNQPAH